VRPCLRHIPALPNSHCTVCLRVPTHTARWCRCRAVADKSALVQDPRVACDAHRTAATNAQIELDAAAPVLHVSSRWAGSCSGADAITLSAQSPVLCVVHVDAHEPELSHTVTMHTFADASDPSAYYAAIGADTLWVSSSGKQSVYPVANAFDGVVAEDAGTPKTTSRVHVYCDCLSVRHSYLSLGRGVSACVIGTGLFGACEQTSATRPSWHQRPLVVRYAFGRRPTELESGVPVYTAPNPAPCPTCCCYHSIERDCFANFHTNRENTPVAFQFLSPFP
jgi:hypothetical protein